MFWRMIRIVYSKYVKSWTRYISTGHYLRILEKDKWVENFAFATVAFPVGQRTNPGYGDAVTG